ncbi:hypothetical protein ABT160_13105 [Streptomyces sp. NPDC001941]|uniref:lectin-like domain-containing protein n=1 Tax=Streptomyces sp. NPDC001941 TaxID=3154659 RepID=UPI00331E4865
MAVDSSSPDARGGPSAGRARRRIGRNASTARARQRLRRRLRRSLTAAGTAAGLAVGSFAAGPPAGALDGPHGPGARPVVERPAVERPALVAESFGGPTVPSGAWLSGPGDPGSGFACLTAASGRKGPLRACPGTPLDKPGRGVLRLTNKTRMQSGYVFLDRPFTSRQGISATFDTFQYDTSTARGADGISFFLVDGSVRPRRPALTGGSLGYRGLEGGYIGLGFDQFGNFSTPEWGGRGGPGQRPNSVALRGATGIGAPYLTGTRTLVQPLSLARAKQRAAALRTMRVRLSSAAVLTVEADFHDGAGYRALLGPVDLKAVPGQPALPDTFKLGFAASTGDSTAIHEVRNLRVEQLPPDLYVTSAVTEQLVAGGTGKLVLTVANRPFAGPNTRRTALRAVLPPGLEPVSAAGSGWTCQVTGARVGCERPGSPTDRLDPGTAYPPVVVDLRTPPDAAGRLPVQVGLSTTDDDTDPRDNAVVLPVPVVSRVGLWITDRVAPDPYVAGGPITYTVSVGNHGPGRARGARVTARVPHQLTGVRWTCEATGGAACPSTRPGPVLSQEVDLPAASRLTFTATGTVPPSVIAPLGSTARVVPPNLALDEDCAEGCDADAVASGSVRTALAVRHWHSPEPPRPGERLTYTTVVRNNGPSDAIGTRIEQDAPDELSELPWTCRAKAPSRCGEAAGRGPLDTTADIVAGGGEVVYTMTGVPPHRQVVSEVRVEPPTLAQDTACENECAAKDTALLP